MVLLNNITIPDHIDADYAFRQIGDSMIHARIQDGDIVFIKAGHVANGELGVIRIGEYYSLKRVYYGHNTLELRSEDPTYPPIILAIDQPNTEIIGKAICVQSIIT